MENKNTQKEIENVILKVALEISGENPKKMSKGRAEKRHNLASDILLNSSIFASKFLRVFQISKEKDINKFVVDIWDKIAGVSFEEKK